MLATPANATPAIADFGTYGYQNNYSSGDRTLGWIFTALDDLKVTHLGVWDHASNGLLSEHQVGIWDSSGALLGSTIVGAGTSSAIIGVPTAGGSFRYESVGGLFLDAGATYTIGALFNEDDIFEFYASSVTSGPEIAFGEERYSDSGAGFAFPTDTYNRWGLFGPNFQYVVHIAEPASIGLLLVGLAGLAVMTRRLRTRTERQRVYASRHQRLHI